MNRGPGRPRTGTEIRFWSKVEKTDDCWNWTGSPNQSGYGRIGTDGSHELAHRYSWNLHRAEPIEGLILDHICLNRLCVNPDHLRVVTQKQNQENLAGAMRNSISGVRGVHRNRNGRPYAATVHHNKQRYYLGRFDSLEEAERAVVAKRLELFTHNERDKADAKRLGLTA